MHGEAMLLAFKIGVLLGIISMLLWIAVYTRLEPWWKNRVGRTLVMLAIMITAQSGIFAASLFFNFNRLTSQVAAWIYIGIFYLIAAGMFHRTWLWITMSKKGTKGTLPAGKTDSEEMP
jgi:hypothetical protein